MTRRPAPNSFRRTLPLLMACAAVAVLVLWPVFPAEIGFLRPGEHVHPAQLTAYDIPVPSQLEPLSTSPSSIAYTRGWKAEGPSDVGGPTSALALDLDYNGTTNQKILAGGAMGGLFLSEDGGESWTMTSSLSDVGNVSTIAQDPGNHDVWYYGTGEFVFSPSSHWGPYLLGQGIFKSTDGGFHWERIEETDKPNVLGLYDRPFDVTWKLIVRQDGTLFGASRKYVVRSLDGGKVWDYGIPGEDSPGYIQHTDVIDTGSALVATFTPNGGADTQGVYLSADNGDTWVDITPVDLVEETFKMQLASPVGNTHDVYLLIQTSFSGAETEDFQLFRTDIETVLVSGWTNLDLAGRLQATTDEGYLDSRRGSSLVLAVKPDDPETIWVGTKDLYRSTDGGTSWEVVGGPDQTGTQEDGQWEGHYTGQHALVFDPSNPNVMYSGTDGGVHRADDNTESPQTWTTLNSGYTTSQFNSIAVVPDTRGDERILGGLQGRAFYYQSSTSGNAPSWENILEEGDGGGVALSPGGYPLYISPEKMGLVRITNEAGIQKTLIGPDVQVDPSYDAPFVLDPNDANVMYLGIEKGVMRNSKLSDIPINENNVPTDLNWSNLENSALEIGITTALAVSTVPAGRLYFGVSDSTLTRLLRVDDPENNGPGTQITPTGLLDGSWISAIEVNPEDADEIVVTSFYYGVSNLFHSTDGGASWEDIKGNMGGESGPWLRTMAFIPTTDATVYLLGTNTGLYGTTLLDGENTVWEQQGADVIGNVVVTDIAFRASDGFVAVATHGRGTYSAYVGVADNLGY